MNIMIFLIGILGLLLIGGILSFVLATSVPFVVTLIISILVFIIFVVLWNAIGIRIVNFFKRIVSSIKVAFQSKDKRNLIKTISAVVILSGVLVIGVIAIFSAFSSDKKNSNFNNNVTTTHKETTRQDTTQEKTTREEKTTTAETQTNEETTIVKVEEKTSIKNVVNKYTKPAQEETTLQNQAEIESSKKQELGISSSDEDVVKVPVATTKNNGVVNVNPPTKKEEVTTQNKVIEAPTTQKETERENDIIVPSFPQEFETTKKENVTTQESTTSFKENVTTQGQQSTTTKETTTMQIQQTTTSSKETSATQPTIEEETTIVTVTPKTDITVSYTSGASVANVLVTFDSSVEAKFQISFDNVETNNYIVNKNSDTSYSIKVTVPSNYLGRLIIRVFDDEGNELKQKIKIINNQ